MRPACGKTCPAQRAVSRVLSRRSPGKGPAGKAISLDPPSRTGSSVSGKRPTRGCRPEPGQPLLGLAPGGVCHATRLAAGAVRSYRTISPLPAESLVTGAQAGPSPEGGGPVSRPAVSFLLHFPCPASGTVGVTHHRGSAVLGLSSPGLTAGSGLPRAGPTRIIRRRTGFGTKDVMSRPSPPVPDGNIARRRGPAGFGV